MLQRPDIDTTLKDNEGYTAFDLYNSTIEGTKPDPDDPDAELFMWGANLCVLSRLRSDWSRYSFPPFRNATLGFSDGNNRSHPDQIVIQPKEHSSYPTWQDKFFPIRVRQVGMSKLHTIVVTSESGNNAGGGNLRVCGFGSGGRLVSNPFVSAHGMILKIIFLQTRTVASPPCSAICAFSSPVACILIFRPDHESCCRPGSHARADKVGRGV